MSLGRWIGLALAAGSAWMAAAAQGTPPAAAVAASGQQKVYFEDRGLTPPSLIEPLTPLAEIKKCSGDLRGRVQLSLIVDRQGHPRDVVVTHPAGNDLDRIAVQVAEADRFTPGSLDGVPVAVGRTVAMSLRACVTEDTDSAGRKTRTLHLNKRLEQKLASAAPPENEIVLDTGTQSGGRMEYSAAVPEKVGGAIAAPKPILQGEASFSDYARRKKIQGTVVLNLIVDAHGLPQSVHVTRSLEESLDRQAIASVERYRFRPAIKAGRPVPVMVSVEVTFRLY